MHPGKEEASLLPLAQTDGGVGVSVSRRPADVFLLRDVSHGPAANDFTISRSIAAQVYRLIRSTFLRHKKTKLETTWMRMRCARTKGLRLFLWCLRPIPERFPKQRASKLIM
eukprot:1251533-Amphidinium_carterae.1